MTFAAATPSPSWLFAAIHLAGSCSVETNEPIAPTARDLGLAASPSAVTRRSVRVDIDTRPVVDDTPTVLMYVPFAASTSFTRPSGA